MRLADELEPKAIEIRRWASELFCNMELRRYGLHFDENGEVAFDRGNPMNQSPMGQPWDEEAQRQLVAVARDKVSLFNSDLESLLARFRNYYDLDSLDFTVMAGILGGQLGAQAAGGPTNVHSRIGYADAYWVARVDGLINEKQWSGNAARAFHDNFLLPFHDAAQKQQAYVTELAIVAQAYHDYVIAIGNALREVADQCIDALGGPDSRTSAEKTAQAVQGLSAASIIFGVLSLFPPLAPVAGPISLGAGIVSFVVPLAFDANPEPQLASVHGDTVWDVLQSAWQALTTIEEAFADGDTRLSTALEQDLTSTQSLAHQGLTINRPDIADQPGGASFGTLTIQSVPGVPVSEDAVVVSLVDLHRAGKVNLAGAAAQYAQASTELRSCTTPDSLAKFFPRSVAKFHEARDRLNGILIRTSQALDDAAAALVEIAEHYQLTDEKSAEALRQMSQVITPSPGPEPSRLGGV